MRGGKERGFGGGWEGSSVTAAAASNNNERRASKKNKTFDIWMGDVIQSPTMRLSTNVVISFF